jgi:nitroimidazol reductase NimA-like FMN-containing flavoprotein (pyridoxamine 5'-phosphate oxidase superfamily)/transcriptional regulator with XRE-family HTH domain
MNLLHPEDIAIVQRQREAVLSGQKQTCEFRLITKGGEVRWLRDVMQPVWDPEQRRVSRIDGVGQDITERKRLEEQLQKRAIHPKDLGANLRRFRRQLSLTQAMFGQAFGGYTQRQITSYETGEIEIPIGLLLAIRTKGYPLEVVLGEHQTDVLDKIVGYLSASWKIHETAKRLTQGVLQLLDRESATATSIMNGLGIVPEEDAARENYTLRDLLRRAGVEPPPLACASRRTPVSRGRTRVPDLARSVLWTETPTTGRRVTMNEEQQRKIAALLAKEHVLVIATLGEEWPTATMQAFAETPKLDFVLIMLESAPKFQNLLKRPQVSLVIDDRDTGDVKTLRVTRVSVQGVAREVQKQSAEWKELQTLFLKKNPFEKPFFSYDALRMVCITPKKITYANGVAEHFTVEL